MKIVIFSDLHDNLVNLDKCLNWCKQNDISILIGCGDITNQQTLEVLAKKFTGPIYLVRGNVDMFSGLDMQQYQNIRYLGVWGQAEIAGQSVGIAHDPADIGRFIKMPEVKIIFYGHTHKPWLETRAGKKLINPGTLGGVFTRATFAFWNLETGELELKILEQL